MATSSTAEFGAMRGSIEAGRIVRVTRACLTPNGNSLLDDGEIGWALSKGRLSNCPAGSFGIEWLSHEGRGFDQCDLLVPGMDSYEEVPDEEVPDEIWAALAKRRLSYGD